jgi:hypothetical protein
VIELTQKKLREARFFLRLLQQENRKAVRGEGEAFEFYLSAFLTSGRAVTWALQYEDKAKYDAWYPGWEKKQSEDDKHLLELMVAQRNKTEKRGGAEVAVQWTDIPITEIRSEVGGHPAYGFHWSGLPGAPPPTVGMPTYSFAGSSDELVARCSRYAELINELVDAFIREYG